MASPVLWGNHQNLGLGNTPSHAIITSEAGSSSEGGHAVTGTEPRVLIIDDDYYAREAMQALVARDSRTRMWGTAGGVGEAIALLDSTRGPRPDVIVLDIRLGEEELGGIIGLPRLKDACPTCRVLVSSISRDEETVRVALLAGADGYVWKNESTDGIAEAIVRVHEGRLVVSASVAEKLLSAVTDLGTYAAEVLPDRQEYKELTEATRKTVYLYCCCGMSAREIADELQLSVNTVNSRIKNAYAVLGAGSRRDAFQRLVERTES